MANKNAKFSDDSFIFVDENGEMFYVEKMNSVFKITKRRTGINISPHILRHFFATQAQSSNINPRLVANFLGHNTIAMTDHYTHATDDGGILVMEKVNQKIN